MLRRKNRSRLLIFVFTISLIIYSCGNRNEKSLNSNLENQSSEKIETDTLEILSYNNFEQKRLPYFLFIGNENWITHDNEGNKILIKNDILKRINDELLKEKLDNCDNIFYEGHRFRFNKNYSGVTIYSNSNEEGDLMGYYLLVYDTNGIIKDIIFLAGNSGEFDVIDQFEAVIYTDSIVQEKYTPIQETINDSVTYFLSDIERSCFRIDEKGRVKKESSYETKNVKMIFNEDKFFRIERIHN